MTPDSQKASMYLLKSPYKKDLQVVDILMQHDISYYFIFEYLK